MIDDVLDHCRAGWTTWFPDEQTPRLSAVLLTRARGENRAILMIMPDGQPVPRLTAKLVWSNDAQAVVDHEAATLRAIPEYFPGLPAMVPRQLATRSLTPGAALITTAVPGRRWRLGRHRWRQSPGVDGLLSRCGAVMDATSCGSMTNPEEHPLSALAPVVAWASGMATSLPQNRRLELLASALESSGHGFRKRWQHGDLATGNVLVGRQSSIGIIDWELASNDLPGWFDTCYVACVVAHEVGPRADLVRWIVEEVVTPRWREPFPLSWGLALVSLIAGQRAWALHRCSHGAWLGVADAMLRTPERVRVMTP
jgi:hypothetical protein